MTNTEQIELIAVEEVKSTRVSKRMLDMYKVYGRDKRHTCSSCWFIKTFKYRRKTYYKCSLNRITGGPATDWKPTWMACGTYKEKANND